MSNYAKNTKNTKKIFQQLTVKHHELTAEEENKLKSSLFKDVGEYWHDFDIAFKQDIMRYASTVEIRYALPILMHGLKSYVAVLNEEARLVLKKYVAVMMDEFNTYNYSSQTLQNSAILAYSLANQLFYTKDLELLQFLITMLLQLKWQGAMVLWDFFVQNLVSRDFIIGIIKKATEEEQLFFVYRYTLAPLPMQRQYLDFIEALVSKIKTKDAWIAMLNYCYARYLTINQIFYHIYLRFDLEKNINFAMFAEYQAEQIAVIKALGASGGVSGLYLCLPLLAPQHAASIRGASLEVLIRANRHHDPKIIAALSKLIIEVNDENFVFRAFEALARLNFTNLKKALIYLAKKFPDRINDLFASIRHLPCKELNEVLNDLPIPADEAKSIVVHHIFWENQAFFQPILTIMSASENTVIAAQAYDAINEYLSNIDQILNKNLSTNECPEVSLLLKYKGLFFDKLRIKKNLTELIAHGKVQGKNFSREKITNLDLTGIELSNINFADTYLLNVNFSGAKLTNVSFIGAYLENVDMTNIQMSSVCCEQSVIKDSIINDAALHDCNFNKAIISNSAIMRSRINDSQLMATEIIGGNLSLSEYNQCTLIGATVADVNLQNTLFINSDLSQIKFKYCILSDVGLINSLTHGMEHIHVVHKNQLQLPADYFADPYFFNMVVRCRDMDRQRDAFRSYNAQRLELAYDNFSEGHYELFQLVPFLIHFPLVVVDDTIKLTTDNLLHGISSYLPLSATFNIAQKYINLEDLGNLTTNTLSIEGLFTIGSIGTIAQSEDSDIDYWVCLEKEKLTQASIKQLEAKLAKLESWADKIFHAEIHFFVVDLQSVRADHFGQADQESSGSAQGKLLKEEFYRTMLWVAGKMPLWCVVPPGSDDLTYNLIKKLAVVKKEDYLDIGNIYQIPREEYFGAAIWQIFKSLKSPFKSILKMALLEKYITETDNTLLCDKGKSLWSSGAIDLKYTDPYLLLFREALNFYQSHPQYPAKLLKMCFFIKLGIKSPAMINNSLVKHTQRVIDEFLETWRWQMDTIMDLGNFKAWRFDRIFDLSTQINQNILAAYIRINRLLKDAPPDSIKITQQDLHILGRKMFVQFEKKTDKIEKLPLASHGKELFKKIYLKYDRPLTSNAPEWLLVHVGSDQVSYLLKKAAHIEEIAIWLIYNELYKSTLPFQILPNPTPVSVQEVLALLQKLHNFFRTATPASKFSEDPKIAKLFTVLNLDSERKLDKYYKYAIIYLTTWGEMFCKTMYSKNGTKSKECAEQEILEQLNIGLDFQLQKDFFIPPSVQHRIR